MNSAARINKTFPFVSFITLLAILFIATIPNYLFAKTTILILGDSLTAGLGVEKQEAFPSLLEGKLKALGYQDITVINGGFSGSTTASALSRMRWYLRSKPDILVLELGANDGLRGHDIQSIEKNLADTIKIALNKKMLVLIAGMKMPVNYGRDYRKKFEEIFPKLARKFSVALIPFFLEGVAGKPHLNIADGIHPNPDGHKIISQTVLKYLLPLLKDQTGK